MLYVEIDSHHTYAKSVILVCIYCFIYEIIIFIVFQLIF